MTEKLENLAVPKEFQTDQYDQLYGLVQRYNRAMASKVADQDYIQDIKNRLNDAESAFRAEITRQLKRNFPNKQARLKAIRTNSNWKWIGQLYPAVFTDDHQILLMSISKFMKKNSCLVEPSYEFLESDLIKDAIIFIDEFDATKATMEEAITEGALSIQEDYLSLFRQILRGLNPKYLSRTMRDAYQNLGAKVSAQFTFEKILKEAQEIEEKYAVYLSYKTAEESVDRKQNFLLKDATYHTLFHDNKGYIRATRNNDENRIDIFFETRKEFYAHVNKNKEENIVVYALLREINRFLIHFRTFLFEWARHYMHEINARRNPEDDELTLENAISTILDKFELSRAGQQLILSEMRSPSVNRKQKELLPDNHFYQQGMEIFELEDQDSHHQAAGSQGSPPPVAHFFSSLCIIFPICFHNCSPPLRFSLSPLPPADPRIRQMRRQVGKGADQDDQKGAVKSDRLDEREIPAADRLKQQCPNTADRENLFHNECPTDQIGKIHRKQHERRHKRIAQNVAVENPASRKPCGAECSHKVRVQHLEDALPE